VAQWRLKDINIHNILATGLTTASLVLCHNGQN